jgi:hypothetical protein
MRPETNAWRRHPGDGTLCAFSTGVSCGSRTWSSRVCSIVGGAAGITESVWIYLDTSKEVGDVDHLKVFATAELADILFDTLIVIGPCAYVRRPTFPTGPGRASSNHRLPFTLHHVRRRRYRFSHAAAPT